MKKRNLILIAVIAMISVTSQAQKKGKVVLNTNDTPDVLHVHLDDFPKDQVLPHIEGWGGMTVDINNAPAGTDFTPLLKGLEDDLCQVPHWGYVVKGSIRIIFGDGSEAVFKEGEAFYMKAGHTGVVLEDLLLVSFSPEDGFHDLDKHINDKVAAMQNQ